MGDCRILQSLRSAPVTERSHHQVPRQSQSKRRNRSSVPLQSVGFPRKLAFQHDPKQNLIERFDNNAAVYDENMEEEEQSSIFRMLELADIKEGECVLDLATGTGLVTDYVVNLVGPSGAVLGLDNSEGMLKRAQEKLDNSPHIQNLAFVHSSVEDADFEPGTLDVILCHNGIFYFQDQVFVAQRAFEWLRKPGGRFVFNSTQVPSHPAMPLFQEVLQTYGIRIQEPCYAVGSDEALHRTFGQAGFDSVQVSRETTSVEYPDLTEYAEDAWQMCSSMTDFDLAEEELQERWYELREIFVKAAKMKRYQTWLEGEEGPVLETTHLWVNATT